MSDFQNQAVMRGVGVGPAEVEDRDDIGRAGRRELKPEGNGTISQAADWGGGRLVGSRDIHRVIEAIESKCAIIQGCAVGPGSARKASVEAVGGPIPHRRSGHFVEGPMGHECVREHLASRLKPPRCNQQPTKKKPPKCAPGEPARRCDIHVPELHVGSILGPMPAGNQHCFPYHRALSRRCHRRNK
jgi:hypothetical protein